jgi:predicted Zn-dependent protease
VQPKFVRKLAPGALLFLALSVHAQTWDARRILANVQSPVVVGKDKNGQEVARFQRDWVERSVRVVDKLAPQFDLHSPVVVIEKSNSPNAFATVTKSSQTVVGINTAMLRVVGDSDDMTAAVIGHELGHLKAKHGESRQNAQTAFTLLGTLLGAAVDVSQAQKGHNTQGAGMALGSVGAGLGVAKFTRDQEREADSLGINAMAQAGYDPRAAARVWQLMAAQGGGGSGLWMSTHPSHSEREETLSAMARTLEPVYAANKAVPATQVAVADPYPRSRYTGFEPGPQETAEQSAYQRGRVAYVERRYSEALPLLEEAAAAGDERANALLGAMAQRGDVTGTPDLDKARGHLEAAASHGYGPAITALGSMSLSGRGLPQDRQQAARMFQFGSDHGDPRGTAMLGMLHTDGTLGTRDFSKARELAQRASDGGDQLGKALLGTLMRDGLGGPADATRSLDLLTESSRTVGWASYQLGLSYERGLGTVVDRDKAIAAHREALKAGVPAAQGRLKALGAQ